MAKVKRDRAAYMRDYRKSRKEQGDPVPRSGPTVASLAERVAHLESLVVGLVEAGGRLRLDGAALRAGHVEITNAPGFGSPRPAPKAKGK